MRVVAPYRDDLVVAVKCIFTGYWLADLCEGEGVAFVLGHALYMKAIHGGKAKNDKIDAHKIAVLLRGGMLPMAYVYPAEMRATRDLLRRRCHLLRKRAELLAHIPNTNSQYNLPEIGKKLAYKVNREGVEENFPEPSGRKTIEVDIALIAQYEQLLGEVELSLTRTAKAHDVQTFARLQSVPDLLAYLQNETELTRSTLVRILKESNRLAKFFVDPQRFMDAVAAILKHELHRLLVNGIKYERLPSTEPEAAWEMVLFKNEELINYLTALQVQKSVYEYVVYDSEVEREFAHRLDQREDIKLLSNFLAGLRSTRRPASTTWIGPS